MSLNLTLSLVLGGMAMAAGSVQVAPEGTHELRQTFRADGSTIHWVLDRRGSVELQGVLVLVQGSGCASVLNSRALEQAHTLAPNRAVVMIERYGVVPGHAPDDIMMDCSTAFLEKHTVSSSANDLIEIVGELRREDWWSILRRDGVSTVPGHLHFMDFDVGRIPDDRLNLQRTV